MLMCHDAISGQTNGVNDNEAELKITVRVSVHLHVTVKQLLDSAHNGRIMLINTSSRKPQLFWRIVLAADHKMSQQRGSCEEQHCLIPKWLFEHSGWSEPCTLASLQKSIPLVKHTRVNILSCPSCFSN